MDERCPLVGLAHRELEEAPSMMCPLKGHIPGLPGTVSTSQCLRHCLLSKLSAKASASSQAHPQAGNITPKIQMNSDGVSQASILNIWIQTSFSGAIGLMFVMRNILQHSQLKVSIPPAPQCFPNPGKGFQSPLLYHCNYSLFT